MKYSLLDQPTLSSCVLRPTGDHLMPSPYVRTEINGPVCTIILNRPDKRNAVDSAIAAALREAFEAFEADGALRVAVMWGAGGSFCSGADLSSMGDPERQLEFDPEGGGSGPMGPARMALSKPLVAAVSGYAVAGGLELALLADLRIAEGRFHCPRAPHTGGGG